jgi:hypothetical protein
MPNPHKRKMRKLIARENKEAVEALPKAPTPPAPAAAPKKVVKKEKKGLLDAAVDALKGKKD